MDDLNPLYFLKQSIMSTRICHIVFGTGQLVPRKQILEVVVLI